MKCLSSSFVKPSSRPNPIHSNRLQFSVTAIAIRCDTKPNSKSTSTATSAAAAATTTITCLDSQSNFKKQNHSPTKRSLIETFFIAFDDFIIKFIDPPLRPSIDPKNVLSGNFAPVGELPPTECQVIHGTLPSCLDGAYIRNGPNPQYFPYGPHFLFDGDGMLHSIRISNGKATLCSRFVKTYKFTVEKNVGSPVIPNVLASFNGVAATIARVVVTAGRILTRQINACSGIGLANTSLFYYKQRLYALGEPDMPYEIKVGLDGEITTVGRHDFDGKLSVGMTAHPKIDPDTGEAFAFRLCLLSPPYLNYFRFDSSGSKQPDVPVFSMTSPSLLHDFAITKNYAIFAEIQIGLDLRRMIRAGSMVGADLTKIPRIGVIPRNAEDESEMLWFEVEGFNMVHVINSWEEDGGEAVVVVAPNIFPIEHVFERMDLIHSPIEKVKINLKTGIVTRQIMSDRNLDFGIINPAFVAKNSRFVYAAIWDPMPKVSGIVKVDLSVADDGDQRDCVVACQMFAPGCYGGEPFFVARESDNYNAEEDDGYLVSYLHDENTIESRFLVMDCKSPTLEVVAAVKLPRRVPYGFHGLFVKECDLKML